MSWFESTEQKRTLLVSGIIIICSTMLAVTALRNIVSYDSFWHLQMGLDWLENGLSPWRDHFSFTFYGEEITGPPYIFDVLIGWLVTQLGLDAGFQVFKFAGFMLVFALFGFFLRKLRAPVVIYCLVLPLIVVLLQLRSLVRPELISYSFIVFAVMLYYRARSGMSAANMLPILALMLLWCNYHSPIFGYIIFFGYFVDIALQQTHNRATMGTWLKWLGWGLAVVAVGFLNPGLNHPLVQLFFFSPEWKDLIQEYQSAILYRELAAVYALIAITLITLALLLWKRQFGLLIVCGLFIFFAAMMARLVTPGGIAILSIFAWMVSEIDLEDQLRRLPEKLVRAAGGAVMVLWVLSIATGVNMAREFMDENRTSANFFPKDVADYMVDQDISGRIFNEYHAGGYLIYRLSPDSKVYIDGRTDILYPVDHYHRLLDAIGSADILRVEIEKYDINLAILENKQHNFSLVRDTGALGLDYVGSKFSLFRRDNPNFPVLGNLLAYPACWKADMTSALAEEQARAIWILPGNSLLFHFMEFVMGYTQAADKISFLIKLGKDDQWSDYRLRFAAYQALNQNLNPIAYELFASIADKDFSDYLGGALAKVRLGEWKTAEQMLDLATRTSWTIKIPEIVTLHGLLAHIRRHVPLKLIDDAYVDQLVEQAGIPPGSISFIVPDIRSFCPVT